MPYIVEKTRNNRTEFSLDLPRFAADLAKELGGKAKPDHMPNAYHEIVLGKDSLMLSFAGSERERDKIKVHAWIIATDVKPSERNAYATQKTESANVSPDARPIAAIAQDIRKRVIEASAVALAKQREYVAELARQRVSLAAHVKTLKATIPSLQINIDESKCNASLYLSEPYFSGRLSPNGRVHIDRIDDVDSNKLLRLLALLK